MLKQTALHVIQLHRLSAVTVVLWIQVMNTKHWQSFKTGDVSQWKQYIILLFAILRLDVLNQCLYLTSESQLCTASLVIAKWKDFDKFCLCSYTTEWSQNDVTWLVLDIILLLTYIAHRAFEGYAETRFKKWLPSRLLHS